MQMTLEQQSKIRAEHDVWVNSVCNGCGQVLAEIRYTHKDEPGEWCSEKCRDGELAAIHIGHHRQVKSNIRNTRLRIVQARVGRQLAQGAKF
jgi:hypothetical protein